MVSDTDSKKRAIDSLQHSSNRVTKDHRRNPHQLGPHQNRADHDNGDERQQRRENQSFAKEQTRLNQIQEAEQMREWVSKEDEFVLKQSKKKASIRVRENRARTIDWLAVTLGVIDRTRDLLEDEEEDEDVEVIDPSEVFEGLNLVQLRDLAKDIDTYLSLETQPANRRYWSALKTICKDHQDRLAPSLTQNHGRSTTSVSADVDRLLGPKTLQELGILEGQIKGKLQSNEPIDVEYWEQLLRSVGVYKSRAELNAVYKSIVQNRLAKLQEEERKEGMIMREKLNLLMGDQSRPKRGPLNTSNHDTSRIQDVRSIAYSRDVDPEPMLRLRPEDKALEVLSEQAFLSKIESERRRVRKLRYVPLKQTHTPRDKHTTAPKQPEAGGSELSRFAPPSGEDFSSATTALYEREVARGVQENEEIFAGEEEVATRGTSQWANKYRPRKPRYFNRVQMGYEWNKYNQTHYDHDNPPPKVVQGYKFNIFYPDLIDKVKAPTYRIERENGRKRGETSAPAGEEDTCLIRFISGPPYEDVAFRILDKKWDLSAQRDRGFRSSFDKGILQLHFQFKKVFYRK